MASAETEVSEDGIYSMLKRADPKDIERRQEAINERLQTTFQKSQQRLAELIDQNSTLPTTVSSVTVLGATNTRRGFLKGVVDPLLSANRDRPYTQSEVIRESAAVAEKLRAFGIFHDTVSTYFDKPPQVDAATTPTDVAVFYSVKERSRLFLKTGTDLGNAEGSAYANAQWRNIFGGAETLDVNASFGTKTRSSYSAALDTPVFSNPDLRFQLGGLQSSTQKLFASHEEVLRGGFSKLRWLSKAGVHELGYSGFRRTVTGLAQNASPTVRNDAGESFKSSISHIWMNDRRDNPQLPTRGYYMKTMSELAGFGRLKGDVAFFKGEVEQQTAIPLGLPGFTFTAGARAGVLYPLTLSGQSSPSPSKINDRFQLGGPTDVRGFRLSGLGPHDGADAVGGDIYAAGGASLLMPLPRVGAERPLRLQAFINAGRLLSLTGTKEGAMSSADAKSGMSKAISELGDGLPSTSAGIGLVYAHEVARFELNFSLPLVVRKGEDARKGVQFGIGINFL